MPRVLPLRRPDVSSGTIAEKYAAGLSTVVIARDLGCSVTLVWERLRKAGVALRKSGAMRPAYGDQHPNWKGARSGYTAKHNLVRRRRGKASHCERCGLSEPSRRYEWANLSGNYDDISDYQSMCVPCHRRYDDKGMGRGASRRKV